MTDIRPALTDFYNTTTRPAIALELHPVSGSGPRELNPASSRVGYLGAVTPEFPWPRGYNDKPMCLIAQLNLAELPSLADYPTDGLLQFFVADDFSFGSDEATTDGKSGCLVRLIPADELDKAQAAEHIPENADYLLSGGHFTVTGTRIQQAISSAENPVVLHELSERGLPTDAATARKLRRIITTHQPDIYPSVFGDGWGHFFHWDPREVGDGQRLLLQLHARSMDDVQLVLGNEGCMSFLINDHDLQRHDFSNITYLLEVS